ncbi:hypothetical protein FHT82_005088 [Rhizobium sp. BK275]|uniref:hypothetical protein n=1 Tax=unclassified Rhizobium TaxID=2613769 RepID=UPI0016127508|nr:MULTISPECIES: hypothetical protein [unclassified Rhizobium]MBB3392307.1 hypothetical protein [Rhizobium sp. BK275]MBB3411088.1 hypothetical protein [Rhizobium sp. BK316]
MAHAIEITSFRLKDGLVAQDFLAANADVEPWLRRQPGFRSRIMVEHEDGTITDMVIWDTARQASDSASRLMRELADSPVHAVIDQTTVSWTIGSVFHQSP